MKIYNTLSGKLEEFVPLENGKVKMYVCGITPQSEPHIGHAMSYINFDVIRRYLTYKGYRVKYIQNFTDIDDKIIAKANAQGIEPSTLAERNIGVFLDAMAALNITPADYYPRATQEVPKIIEMVSGLIEKGYAYAVGGSVYLRVQKVDGYGKLSHRTLEQMMAGARVEIDEEKEYPMDFALWKATKPGEPSWESPWGLGRPGWHIECSAMSLRYLGEQIDIHGGGQDLIFPHHENEIAQSECFSGVKPFVKYWLHNGLLKLGEEKMSKSLGNLVTIKEALSRYSADALRIFVLSSSYRNPLTYSEEALEAAEKGAERLRQTAARKDNPQFKETAVDTKAYRERFTQYMDNDFNTSAALATIFDLSRELNRIEGEAGKSTDGQKLFKELADILGLSLIVAESKTGTDVAPFIELLIELRKDLRVAKQYQLADKIRTSLDTAGILLEDSAGGTVWKVKK
ncbi:cysteinyl-tRNA synthetase [Dehalococcoides mccartyi]|jgi:cysteinyl-tRNA synthetase|uniref:cysteine--tRNA ligase n=1 Tax=Dehalococcoides mccartyi TaxID=61435 RepID=UPI00071C92B0|nr:cysteine--tRNA ligase [Dehalococcoides mccartyi]AQU05192.1 cysteine--tRNA ligase [Dehalococcoides mccartyi]AQU06672.1 cysteine--tRNA ligase [Dehalococcoides mccartyi]AQW61765.1 cysteine--tRNA ligase [Dehalococcoides mccartyi]KSV18134.1 cysteinyl-tRNA synthetase [Dehalococcoides mccartyi]